jgi:hypothetical protein
VWWSSLPFDHRARVGPTERQVLVSGVALANYVREVLRQLELLRLANEYDDVAPFLREQDEAGTRRREEGTGHRRRWTRRDSRDDADYLRTERFLRRFKPDWGELLEAPLLRLATDEARREGSLSVVAPLVLELTEAHRGLLSHFDEVIGNVESVDMQHPWGDVMDRHRAAVDAILPYLPPDSVKIRDGNRHPKSEERIMSRDIVAVVTDDPKRLQLDDEIVALAQELIAIIEGCPDIGDVMTRIGAPVEQLAKLAHASGDEAPLQYERDRGDQCLRICYPSSMGPIRARTYKLWRADATLVGDESRHRGIYADAISALSAWVRYKSKFGLAKAGNADVEDEAELIECHVTLTQMAAIVNKSKRTLERLRDDGKLPMQPVNEIRDSFSSGMKGVQFISFPFG